MTIHYSDLNFTSYTQTVQKIADIFAFTRVKNEKSIIKADIVSFVGAGKSSILTPLKSRLQNILSRSDDKNSEISIGYFTVDANTLTEFSQAGVDAFYEGEHIKTKPAWFKRLKAMLDEYDLVIFHLDEFFVQSEVTQHGWLNFMTAGRMAVHELTADECYRTCVLITGNGPGMGGQRCINSLANTTRGASFVLAPTLAETANYIASKGLLPAPVLAWVKSGAAVEPFQLTEPDSNKQIANSFTPRSFEAGCRDLSLIPGNLSDEDMKITEQGYSYLEHRWPSYTVEDLRVKSKMTDNLTPWQDIVNSPLKADIPENPIAQHIQASLIYSGLNRQLEDPRYIPAMVLYLSREPFDYDVLASSQSVLLSFLNSDEYSLDRDLLQFCYSFVHLSRNDGVLAERSDGSTGQLTMEALLPQARALYAQVEFEPVEDEVEDPEQAAPVDPVSSEWDLDETSTTDLDFGEFDLD